MGSPIYANNALFNKDENNMSTHWRLLKSRLSDLGYDFVTDDNIKVTDCERIIFMDATSLGEPVDFKTKIKIEIKTLLGLKNKTYPTRKLYQEAINAGMRSKMILFIWEGKSVCPSNFYKSTWDKFDKILTWDDDLVDNKKFFKSFVTSKRHIPITKVVPFDKKKLLVNMSINRLSSYKNELYSKRKEAIEYFDKYYPNDFDLYGFRWGKPVTKLERIFPFLTKNYATYQGQSKNKVETLSHYKFNICYENNSDANGYVTEKIFDSFGSRIVPIYLGAKNIEKYVDTNAFIDRRKFKSNADLAEFITKMTEEEYNKYLVAGEQCLKSDQYFKFTPEYFSDNVIKALNLKLNT